jgi:DMSO/TMAO reductase YedYZ molybdopterin-dependent catalytic subunit
LAGLAGLAGWRYLLHTPEADGIPSALRRVLDFNAQLTSDYYRRTRLAPEFASARAQMPRANGSYGLDEDGFDPAAWQLTVQGFGPNGRTQSFSIKQIKTLPRTEFTTELKCIEGWSTIVSWAGVRFVDFLAHFPLATRSGQPIADASAPPPATWA